MRERYEFRNITQEDSWIYADSKADADEFLWPKLCKSGVKVYFHYNGLNNFDLVITDERPAGDKFHTLLRDGGADGDMSYYFTGIGSTYKESPWVWGVDKEVSLLAKKHRCLSKPLFVWIEVLSWK